MIGYDKSMKSNTKSSITLPPGELKLVLKLQKQLKARSKVEVVRLGLQMLNDATEREMLRDAFRKASVATRKSLGLEMKDVDGPYKFLVGHQ